MSQKKMLAGKAAYHFSEGYNCAQSVLLTMFEHWKGKNDLIPKVATAFGGGIGRCGSVCGALTGGIMAISIKYGTNDTSLEKRLKAYEVTQKFYRKFLQCHGSSICQELIGYDLSNPEDLKKAQETNVFDEKCTRFVRTTVEILFDLT
jgi:C_GCAxxG_C_C family probable redox protein